MSQTKGKDKARIAWEKQVDVWVMNQKTTIKESEFLVNSLQKHIAILKEKLKLERKELLLKQRTLSESLKNFKK